MGLAAAAIWSMMLRAVRVGKSVGELNSVAVARQWMQRRLQPLVTSQKIRRGLLPLSWWGCCPLPFGEPITRPPLCVAGTVVRAPPSALTIENREHGGRDCCHWDL